MDIPNEENFNVVVRVRPHTQKELNQISIQNSSYNIKHLGDSHTQNKRDGCLLVENDKITLIDQEYKGIDRKEKQFQFKHVYGETHSNMQIFNDTIMPSLDFLIKGYSTTIFAYGMTGSGKTHTIFGDNQQEPGICQLSLSNIVKRLTEVPEIQYQLKLSYIEIYNETVRDLLAEQQKSLLVIEDQIKGCVIVQDLSEYSVQNIQQIEELISQGNKRRVFSQTHANQFSSRSHAILQFSIEMKHSIKEKKCQIVTSKLTLIDLAGSEKVGNNEIKSKGLLEGANINKSLLALGNCINILSDKSKKGTFVPYRDSKLTRLLKECLGTLQQQMNKIKLFLKGGNSKTIMIACVSPSVLSFEETFNTLSYANRAQQIKSRVQKNIREAEHQIDPRQKDIIDHLNQEIFNLQQMIKQPSLCPQCQDAKQEQENLKNEISLMENKIKQIKSTLPNLDILDEKDQYIERICNDLANNIEEHYEINVSLKELNEIINLNNAQIQEEIFNAQNFKNLKSKKESEEKLILLKQNTRENEIIKVKLIETLSVNQNQKLFMKKLLVKVSENTKIQNYQDELKFKGQQLHNIALILQNYDLLKQIFEKDAQLKEKDDSILLLQQENNKKQTSIKEDSSRKRSSNLSFTSQQSKELTSYKSESQIFTTNQKKLIDDQCFKNNFKKQSKSPKHLDFGNQLSPKNIFNSIKTPQTKLSIRSPQNFKSPQALILSGVKERLRSESASKRQTLQNSHQPNPNKIFHSQCSNEQIRQINHESKNNYSSLLKTPSIQVSIDNMTRSPSVTNSTIVNPILGSFNDPFKQLLPTKLKSPQIATIQLFENEDNLQNNLFNKSQNEARYQNNWAFSQEQENSYQMEQKYNHNNNNNIQIQNTPKIFNFDNLTQNQKLCNDSQQFYKQKDSQQNKSNQYQEKDQNIFNMGSLSNNFFKVENNEDIIQFKKSRNTSQSKRYQENQNNQILYSEFTLSKNYNIDSSLQDNIYGSIVLKETTNDFKNKLMSPFYKQEHENTQNLSDSVVLTSNQSSDQKGFKNKENSTNYEPFMDQQSQLNFRKNTPTYDNDHYNTENYSLIGSPIIQKTSKTLYAQQNFIKPYTNKINNY